MSREIKFRSWNKTDRMEFFDLKRINEESESFYRHAIESSFVMQYTGLKDKNGIEIYEDDVLIDDDGRAGVIKYGNGAYYISNGLDVNGEDIDEDFQHMDEFTVIGNIYEEIHLGGE